MLNKLHNYFSNRHNLTVIKIRSLASRIGLSLVLVPIELPIFIISFWVSVPFIEAFKRLGLIAAYDNELIKNFSEYFVFSAVSFSIHVILCSIVDRFLKVSIKPEITICLLLVSFLGLSELSAPSSGIFIDLGLWIEVRLIFVTVMFILFCLTSILSKLLRFDKYIRSLQSSIISIVTGYFITSGMWTVIIENYLRAN